MIGYQLFLTTDIPVTLNDMTGCPSYPKKVVRMENANYTDNLFIVQKQLSRQQLHTEIASGITRYQECQRFLKDTVGSLTSTN